MFLLLAGIWLLIARAHAFDQHTLSLKASHLSELSTDSYTALVHPRFPGHRVRVKKTEFCDNTVKYCNASWKLLLSRLILS